jgi:hypothetical protein
MSSRRITMQTRSGDCANSSVGTDSKSANFSSTSHRRTHLFFQRQSANLRSGTTTSSIAMKHSDNYGVLSFPDIGKSDSRKVYRILGQRNHSRGGLLEKSPVDFLGQPVQGVPPVEHIVEARAEQVRLRSGVQGRFRCTFHRVFMGFTSIPGNYYTSQRERKALLFNILQ